MWLSAVGINDASTHEMSVAGLLQQDVIALSG